MKKLKISLLVTLMLLLISNFTNSQNGNNTQAYAIHVDPVYPSKINEYETVSKKLADECSKYNTEQGWDTFQFNSFNYTYISPLKNMAELDKNGFADLREKMGKESFEDLFRSFNNYYDSHADYVIVLDKELSYMPDGITITPEGLNYRHNTLFYFAPRDYDKMMQVAKDFKKLYTDKGSTQYYRIYHSGYGSDGTYLLVAEASKDAATFEKNEEENWKLLGEDAKKIYSRLLAILLKTETMTGYFRPDLSYSPK